MATENDNTSTTTEQQTTVEDTQNTQQSQTASTPDIEQLVQKRIDEQFKELKQKLNNAFASRDEALKKIAEFERKEKEAEIARLKEEGKLAEAYEKQLAEEKARAEALERRNIELTRDLEVRNILATQPFRNDNALEMAYREIVGQLVRNEQGMWVHKSGVTIRDFVKTFAESSDNEFLFKPKANTGAGTSSSRPATSSSEGKSIFALSQEEVLKLAAEGKLPRK